VRNGSESPAKGGSVGPTATRRSGRSRRSSSAPCATAVSSGSTWSQTDRASRLADHAASAPVVLGQDLRDLGAAVAVRHVEWLGGSVSVDGETLTIRLASVEVVLTRSGVQDLLSSDTVGCQTLLLLQEP
jgi:hypothetical protein